MYLSGDKHLTTSVTMLFTSGTIRTVLISSVLLLGACQHPKVQTPQQPPARSLQVLLESKKEKALSWESEIKKLEVLDSLEQDPDQAILFTGSSSIRLWDSIATDMAPYPIIKRGYGGARLSDYAYYTERIVYPHRPRAICLFIANDIAGVEEDVSPQEAFLLWEHVYQTIRRQHAHVPVYFIGVTPTNSRWQVWAQIEEFHQLIRRQAQQDHALYFIDTQEPFMAATGRPDSSLFRADQLHLNREGYMRWSSLIKASLGQTLSP